MNGELTVIILCATIWLFVFLISFRSWKPLKENRMAVSEQGELIELDEHEDIFSEERMQ